MQVRSMWAAAAACRTMSDSHRLRKQAWGLFRKHLRDRQGSIVREKVRRGAAVQRKSNLKQIRGFRLPVGQCDVSQEQLWTPHVKAFWNSKWGACDLASREQLSVIMAQTHGAAVSSSEEEILRVFRQLGSKSSGCQEVSGLRLSYQTWAASVASRPWSCARSCSCRTAAVSATRWSSQD